MLQAIASIWGHGILNQCDVVIVNFNAGAFLKDAVANVLSPSVAHVFVIDNASCDASLDLIADMHDDRVTTIRNTANLGFAAGCNIGLSQVRAESVLLLNPDCQVVGNAIERLMAVLQSGNRVGMVGPLLLNPNGSEQPAGRRRFPTLRTLFAQALGFTRLGRLLSPAGSRPHEQPLPSVPGEIDAISGACMMVRREAVADVGPLDEGYFLHFEDLDWCMRFHQRKWTILFVPDAKVIHTKGVSSKHRPLAVEYYKHRGMVRFYRKFLSDAYPAWSMVLVGGGVWLRFAAVAMWRLMAKPLTAPPRHDATPSSG
jgi:hypothetical protein